LPVKNPLAWRIINNLMAGILSVAHSQISLPSHFTFAALLPSAAHIIRFDTDAGVTAASFDIGSK
jgi:hypothetical protein